MVDNKADAVKETINSNKEVKFFQSNHEYKFGDQIHLFTGNPEEYKNGSDCSDNWPVVFARYDFKSGDKYDPADWTTQDPTPREKIELVFRAPTVKSAKEGKDIRIDITELLEEYFNEENMGITDEHPLSYAAPNFKGLYYEGVKNGKVVKVQNSGAVTSESIHDLNSAIQQLFETSLVNQRQLESTSSMARRLFRDFENRTLLPIFEDLR